MKTTLRSLLALILILTAASCDSAVEDPTEAPLTDDGSGIVGTLGGIVYVGDTTSPVAGASVIIPEGALTTPVDIRISGAPAGITLPGDPQAVVVRFEPSGTQFNQPVAIGLSYAGRPTANPADYKIVHFEPSTGAVTDLQTLSVDTQSLTVFAMTTHFSYFALTTAASAGAGELKDRRNNKTYPTVTIGTQTWMAQNLNYPNGSGACYGGDPAACEIWGYLYTWQGALSACPSGWKLPTDDDWKTLELFMGVDPIFLEHPNAYRGIVANVGGRLKGTAYWDSPNEGANNETGFNAIPADMGFSDGWWDLPKPNEHANFWTATEVSGRPESAHFRRLWSRDNGIYRSTGMPKGHKLSVRCIKR